MQAGRWIMGGQPVTLRIGMNAPLNGEARDLLNQIGNQLQEGGFDRQVYMVPSDDWVQKAVTGNLRDQYDALIGQVVLRGGRGGQPHVPQPAWRGRGR